MRQSRISPRKSTIILFGCFLAVSTTYLFIRPAPAAVPTPTYVVGIVTTPRVTSSYPGPTTTPTAGTGVSVAGTAPRATPDASAPLSSGRSWTAGPAVPTTSGQHRGPDTPVATPRSATPPDAAAAPTNTAAAPTTGPPVSGSGSSAPSSSPSGTTAVTADPGRPTG